MGISPFTQNPLQYSAPTYEQQLGSLTPEYDMSGNPTGRYIGYGNMDGSPTYYDAGTVNQGEQGYTQTVASYETPQQQLYRQVAGGEVKLTPEQFDTLLSNEDRALSAAEFAMFSPETQTWAKQNPQLFTQSLLANRNYANADLGSVGAEGGYSNLSAITPTANGLDYSKAGYINVNEEPDWGLYAALALMGGAAYAGYAGAAAGAGSGAGAAAGGSFVPSAATGGMMGLGAPASTALGLGYGGAGALGAGMTSAELAALYAGGVGAGTTAMGALAGTGGGIMTAAGGAAFDAAMASGAGYDAAMQAAMAAGGDVGAGGGWLSTTKDAYDMYGNVKKANSAYNALTGGGATAPQGGGMATGTDWGSMFGNLVGGAGTYLGGTAAMDAYGDKAAQLADRIKFTPYAISSNLGSTYQDPTTGQMMSQMSPETQQMYNTFGDAVAGNMQYASMDPMEASQYAYNMGSSLNAYQDEQNRLGLENRLLSQGMLGSTGGGTQMRSLYDAMNQRDLGREAQSLQLGRGMLDSYQNRAISAYAPMSSMNQQMASQVGQSGTFGGQAMSGQAAGANLMNDAYLGQLGINANAVKGLFGSPTFSSSGQQTGAGGLINQGINYGTNAISDWLGGSGSTMNWDAANNAYDNTWTSGNFDTGASDYFTWDY